MAHAPGLYDADFIGETPRRSKVRSRHQKKMLHLGPSGEQAPFRHVALAADVALAAPVMETEDRRKLEDGIRAIFPDAAFEEGAGAAAVRARARDLARLAEVLRHTRIRDAARPVLKEAVGADGVMRFKLNKQAACAAHVNFVEGGEVLGEIDVEIRAPQPEFLAEELTWIEGESDERLFGTKLHTLPPRLHRRA